MADGGLDRNRDMLEQAIVADWDRFVSSVQLYVARFAYGKVDPEVVAQDSVRLALEHAGQFDPARPVYPWLLKIALNRIKELRRAAQRAERRIIPIREVPQVRGLVSRGVELTEEDMFDVLNKRSDLPLGAESSSQLPTFDELLARVREADRELVRMAYVDQLSRAEMATRLGLTEGAVRTRLSRALSALRRTSWSSGSLAGKVD